MQLKLQVRMQLKLQVRMLANLRQVTRQVTRQVAVYSTGTYPNINTIVIISSKYFRSNIYNSSTHCLLLPFPPKATPVLTMTHQFANTKIN